MKTCTKCKVEKERSDFYKRRRSPDGLKPLCKICENADAYRRGHTEHGRALDRIRTARYRRLHRARSQRSNRKNKMAHPERRAWLCQKSRAKARGIGFFMTFEQWRDWWGDRFQFRGRGADALCMGRYDDKGSYRLGNIYVVSNSENMAGPRPLPVPTW